MDISSLSEAIYEDLNASIAKMHFASDGSLVLSVESDDWTNNSARRHFQLVCRSVVEVRCSPGAFGSLGFFTSHPLLLSFTGPQSQLFFSSAPLSAGEVFLAAHSSLSESLQGWRSPDELLVHRPAAFGEVLARGHGLLARGPTEILGRLATSIGNLIDVTNVPSHALTRQVVAVTFDSQWVLCGTVEVAEVAAN